MGMGKSFTGNNILKQNAFTHGSQVGRITKYITIGKGTEYIVADCVGIGDDKSDKQFAQSFLDKEGILTSMAPVHAILFVVKFTNKESNSFEITAKEFFNYFRAPAIKSIVLVCIQDSIIQSDDEFRKTLYKSAGYRFLYEKNKNNHIPYVLWDNLHDYYVIQESNLRSAINLVKPYNTDMMAFLFDQCREHV